MIYVLSSLNLHSYGGYNLPFNLPALYRPVLARFVRDFNDLLTLRPLSWW